MVAEIVKVTPNEERLDGFLLVTFTTVKNYRGHGEDRHDSPFADEVPTFSEESWQAVSQTRGSPSKIHGPGCFHVPRYSSLDSIWQSQPDYCATRHLN